MKQLSRDSGRGGSLKRGCERLVSPPAAAAPLSPTQADQPPPLILTKLPEEIECEALAKEIMEDLVNGKEIEQEKKLRPLFGELN